MKKVKEYYNDHVAEEDKRLDKHPFELPVTMHFVTKYLNPGDQIFDIGCGTGRYARELLNKGFFVGLSDLSDQNIRLAKKRVETHRNLLFIENSDALESKYWNQKQWDGILILGPLYHMISKKKRLTLLSLAKKHLKPGGVVFSAFMTRIGALVYGVKHNPNGIFYPDGARKLWATGTDDRFVEATEYFTGAYFAHPSEVNPLMEEAGLEPLHLAGAEGFFGERFELFHSLDDKLKDAWMEFVIDHCEDPQMVQQSKHLLSVARKPQ
ncbi:MAG: class I SAM-dependent methyltransferase [Bacteroidales bacterium]